MTERRAYRLVTYDPELYVLVKAYQEAKGYTLQEHMCLAIKKALKREFTVQPRYKQKEEISLTARIEVKLLDRLKQKSQKYNIPMSDMIELCLFDV